VIREISSDLPTFKTLRFKQGLNILLADKSPGATEKQTRNRAGKSSLIEIIHFLFGADCGTDSIFRSSALSPFSFAVAFDLREARVVVTRSGSKPSRIAVRSKAKPDWPLIPRLDPRTGMPALSNNEWRQVLGSVMFGLPAGEETTSRHGPSFRSLFSYFARRQSGDGFSVPTQNSGKQQLWDQQVAVTFLLGLDWSIPRELEQVREREKAIRTLRAAARQGVLGPMIPTAADLRTQVTLAEERARRLQGQLADFRVLPEYHDLEREASQLTVQLGDASNENILDRQSIQRLQETLSTEVPPEFADVRKLYEQAGVVLADSVTKRFEDVQEFHDSIVRNRRSHLQGEIEAAQRRITGRTQRVESADKRRADIMTILRSSGALDQYVRLQAELSKIESHAESLRQRFAAAQQLETTATELQIDRARLLRRLQEDYEEESARLSQAILTFERLSTELYERAGSLRVNATNNGPAVEVAIEGQRSRGIRNMQVFCFDLLMVRLCHERGLGPGFLVHDSHLFDGVDERQVTRALELGAQEASQLGYQYIVTMNSDVLPSSFNTEEHLLPVRLTDATEDGGLFGFRFD
jgi:uncharacterized protein YydD (DUF2326 family)